MEYDCHIFEIPSVSNQNPSISTSYDYRISSISNGKPNISIEIPQYLVF